jgi:pullulanase/glycogen debranching enzyme
MTVASGRSFPLGATLVEDGVNFCVFSRKASAVELLLFDGACEAEPARHPPRSGKAPDLPLLARLRARTARRTGLRIPRHRCIHAHGVRLNEPDLSSDSHSLAFTVRNKRRAVLFHVMFNAYWEPLSFELPSAGPDIGAGWLRWIDTYRDAPDDVCDKPPASPVVGVSYTVQARSLVVLFAVGKEDTLGAA